MIKNLRGSKPSRRELRHCKTLDMSPAAPVAIMTVARKPKSRMKKILLRHRCRNLDLPVVRRQIQCLTTGLCATWSNPFRPQVCVGISKRYPNQLETKRSGCRFRCCKIPVLETFMVPGMSSYQVPAYVVRGFSNLDGACKHHPGPSCCRTRQLWPPPHRSDKIVFNTCSAANEARILISPSRSF